MSALDVYQTQGSAAAIQEQNDGVAVARRIQSDLSVRGRVHFEPPRRKAVEMPQHVGGFFYGSGGRRRIPFLHGFIDRSAKVGESLGQIFRISAHIRYESPSSGHRRCRFPHRLDRNAT